MDEISKAANEVLGILFERSRSDALILDRLRYLKGRYPIWWASMAEGVFGIAKDAQLLMPEGVLVQIKQFGDYNRKHVPDIVKIDGTFAFRMGGHPIGLMKWARRQCN